MIKKQKRKDKKVKLKLKQKNLYIASQNNASVLIKDPAAPLLNLFYEHSNIIGHNRIL